MNSSHSKILSVSLYTKVWTFISAIFFLCCADISVPRFPSEEELRQKEGNVSSSSSTETELSSSNEEEVPSSSSTETELSSSSVEEVPSSSSTEMELSSSSVEVLSSSSEDMSSSSVFKCGEREYNFGTHFCDNRDSTIYKFVEIGEQIWMAENLKYDNENDNVFERNDGIHYQWAKINEICPTSWHLPSKDEFDTLINTVGSTNQTTNLQDNLGFAALLLGRYGNDKSIQSKDYTGFFWSETNRDNTNAYYMCVGANCNGNKGHVGHADKAYYQNVRCIKDE
jgi:uncharacterized protein (TIGR02145 family)